MVDNYNLQEVAWFQFKRIVLYSELLFQQNKWLDQYIYFNRINYHYFIFPIKINYLSFFKW